MVGDIFWEGLHLGKQSEGIIEFSTVRELLVWLSDKKVNKANYLSLFSVPTFETSSGFYPASRQRGT